MEEEKSTKNENVLDMDKIDKVTEIILTIKNDTDEIKKENKVIRQKIQEKNGKRNKRNGKGERKEDRKQIEGTGDQRRTIGEENDKNDTTGREREGERRERRNNITLKGEDLPRGGSPRER